MSGPRKRSISIDRHRTSVSLEAPFWDALESAALREGVSVAGLVARIDRERGSGGLSSAIRVWLLDDARSNARNSLAQNGCGAAARGAVVR